MGRMDGSVPHGGKEKAVDRLEKSGSILRGRSGAPIQAGRKDWLSRDCLSLRLSEGREGLVTYLSF